MSLSDAELEAIVHGAFWLMLLISAALLHGHNVRKKRRMERQRHESIMRELRRISRHG